MGTLLAAAIACARLRSEGLRAREELRAAEQLYGSLVEQSPDAIFVRVGGEIVYSNSAGARLVGAESPGDLVGRTALDFVSDHYRNLVAERGPRLCDEGSSGAPLEIEIVRLDGVARNVELTAARTMYRGRAAAQVVARDISERKQLEARVLHSEKLESIGRVAGGVAHDFNNLLTGILGYAQVGASAAPPGEGLVSTSFQEIQRGAERASHLAQQLLDFSRRQAIRPTVISLGDLVIDMDRMLRRVIGEHIVLETIPGAGPDLVRVDPGQMEQVLVNLIVNARDAMPEGGRLTVETANVIKADVGAPGHDGPRPGEYVVLVVADNGQGMTDDVKDHLFEPYFTTKEAGMGTGLGLSTCHGIVAQNGGHIELDSEPGRGTEVRVYLPRVEEVAVATSQEEQRGDMPKGSETVLLVEDEELVRAATARVLRGHGYQVIEAANGVEALKVAREHAGERIDILLADVVMPEMGGLEVAARLKSKTPELKVLFTTGYPDETLARAGALRSDIELVRKPMIPSALTRRLREVLDR